MKTILVPTEPNAVMRSTLETALLVARDFNATRAFGRRPRAGGFVDKAASHLLGLAHDTVHTVLRFAG